MPEIKLSLPRLDAVLHAEAKPERKSAVLICAGKTGGRYALELSETAIPAMVATLSGEYAKLRASSKAPPEKLQELVVTGSAVASRPAGRGAILFRLETGADLPVVLNRDMLAALREQIDTLLAGAKRIVN